MAARFCKSVVFALEGMINGERIWWIGKLLVRMRLEQSNINHA